MHVAVRLTCNWSSSPKLDTLSYYRGDMRSICGCVERRHVFSVVKNFCGKLVINNCSNLMRLLKWKTNAVGVMFSRTSSVSVSSASRYWWALRELWSSADPVDSWDWMYDENETTHSRNGASTVLKKDYLQKCGGWSKGGRDSSPADATYTSEVGTPIWKGWGRSSEHLN